MPAIEDELRMVEELMRVLTREYQMYVSGQRRRRPEEERQRLDQMMRRLGSMGLRDNVSRFRLQNLVVKYNLSCERWDKQVRSYEEGPIDPRERARLLRSAYSGGGTEPGAPEVPKAAAAPAANAKPRRSVEIRVGEERDEDLQRIWQLYTKARETTGEGAGAVKFDRFKQLIQDQGASLSRRTGSNRVEFDVKIKDGKVKLVAKPRGGD